VAALSLDLSSGEVRRDVGGHAWRRRQRGCERPGEEGCRVCLCLKGTCLVAAVTT
jgi:hypothetical protein